MEEKSLKRRVSILERKQSDRMNEPYTLTVF